jgi:hypothetical protein
VPAMFFPRPEAASATLPPHAGCSMHLDSPAGSGSYASSARNLTRGDRNRWAIHACWHRGHAQEPYGEPGPAGSAP